MPSIVDPSVQRGGAWTVSRGFLHLLESEPLTAEVEVIAVPLRSPVHHRARQCAAIARSLVRHSSAKIEFCRSRQMLKEVRRRCEQDVDLILINGTDLSWLLEYIPSPVGRLLIAHNIEHLLLRSQMGKRLNSGGLVGRLLRRDYRHHRRSELSGLRRVGGVVFLSTLDADYARSHCPDLRTLTVPPFFCYEAGRHLPRKREADSIRLGMLANFRWWPNREALKWFLQSVLPSLRPEIQVHLFGHGSRAIGPRHPRVHRHGHTEDLGEVWAECDIMICPERSGGGVSVKAAEALFNGLPLVGTLFSARGLPVDPDPSIILLDEPEEWIELLNVHGHELKERRVPPQVSARFSAEHLRKELTEFIVESLR